MSAAANPHARSQALPSLLLEHVSRLELGFSERPSAFDRLQHELGPELAARLVSALAGDHGIRRVLRASSPP